MRQIGPSARLKHSSQRPTFSFTSRIASASAAASSSGARSRWKASRCAVRWPIPGSRESSATRRASGAGPSALTFPERPPRPPVMPPIFEPASSWAARSASLTAACTISASSSASSGSIASGSIVDLAQSQVAAHLHLDHAAAGARLDDLVFELLLRLQHLALHLLRLFHQGVHVEAPGHSLCHLADLLGVELALQSLHKLLLVDLLLRGGGVRRPPRRRAARTRAATAPRSRSRAPSATWSRFSASSALRLLKVEAGGNPIVRVESSRSSPTGRAPSKVAASAGLVSPSLSRTAGQTRTHLFEVQGCEALGPRVLSQQRPHQAPDSGSSALGASAGADAAGGRRGSALARKAPEGEAWTPAPLRPGARRSA